MSDLYRSRAPRSSSRRQQQTALPAEITTPVAQAFSSEYQAAAEVNKQAEEQDLIKQQQEAEQERQQINRQSVATAKRVGQQTQMDPLTGAESVKKDTATGKPVWEAGFIGDPTPDNEGKIVVPYRFPDGRTLPVPLDRVNKKTEKTGENFLEFDYQDETGNVQRIRRPEDKSKPLFQTDEATGQRYRDVPDATGSMVRQPLGIDPVAANQARINKRKEAYAKEKEALKFQDDKLVLETQGEELKLKPIKEKLTEAEKLAKQYAPEAAKDKNRYELRPDGYYRVDGAFGDLPAIPRKIETPDEIAAANNWLKQKEQADKQYQGIKAEHDPIKQRLNDLEKKKYALAKQALSASERAQTDIADMEIAALAGLDLNRPQWKQILDIAKKDEHFQKIMAAGEAADQGSQLADAIASSLSRHNKKVEAHNAAIDFDQVWARTMAYMDGKTPPTMKEEYESAQVQAEQDVQTSLVDMLASGVRGDKGAATVAPQRIFPTKHPKATDGRDSNVLMAGVNLGGKEFVIPTMIDGKEVSIEEAVAVARKNGLDNYPSFATEKEATTFARQNHGNIDENGFLRDPATTNRAREIATKSLGVQDPENWSLSPDNRGNYNLHHTSDEAPLGWLDTKNKRVMLFPSATVTDAGQQLLEKASADGFPVFHMGSEATGGGVPMTHQELRDYVAKGVEIARSAATPDEKEALLAKEGITPTDIREQVMAGRMSVQDGRWLNEKLFEVKELDNSPDGYAKGFADYLSANPAQAKIMASGTREQKLAVANNYSDARAGQSAGNMFYQRDTLADRRVELAQKVAPTGKVEKITTGAKQILAPMVGLLAQMPAWAFQEALKRAGSETEAGRLADEQFGDWQKRTSGFFHRINARDDVTESLTEFKQWANRARPGEQPPDELANKVARSVFDGYHQLTEESARDLNTSLDTFNVNKDPKLQALLQRYLTTSDPSAFEQMASMMVMDGKDRKTQAEVMKYIERPRAATPELVADRAKELGLNIQPGAAPRLLEMATALGNSKDAKQYQSIVAQAGKMLGTSTESDTIHALQTITTEATDDPDSWWGLTKGGFVAGRQEAVTELLSTAAEGGLAMLTGGAATPEILAGKAARRTMLSAGRAALKRTATAALDALADESKLFAATRAGFNRGRAKLGSVIAKDAEAFAKEGITTPKFGVPLTAGQKLKNAAVTVGKTAAAAAPIEATEEGVAAIGDVDPTIRGTVEQMGMGAIGAGLITPIFLGAATVRNVFQARKAEKMLGQAKAQWVEKFNERHAKVPGFKPITVAQYDVWSGTQDNPAHKQGEVEYQSALAEKLAAYKEAESTPVAGPATAAPPAPQPTPGATPDATSQKGQGQGQEVLTPAPEATPVAEAQPAPATTPTLNPAFKDLSDEELSKRIATAERLSVEQGRTDQSSWKHDAELMRKEQAARSSAQPPVAVNAAQAEEEPVMPPDPEDTSNIDQPFAAPATRPLTPRQIAADARLEAAIQNLAGLSQIAFSASEEIFALPEADRPLYTAVAKAKAGSTIYTADEAKALIRQNGANAVTFQKAEILPPDVQGPRNLKTLSELPDAIKVGPALYRLPEGVQIAIPDALTASVVANAPSLGILLQTSAQAQAAAKPTVSPEYLAQWEQFGAVKSEGGAVAVTSDTRKAHEAAMFALKQAGIRPNKVVTGPGADGKTAYTILFDAPKASVTSKPTVNRKTQRETDAFASLGDELRAKMERPDVYDAEWTKEEVAAINAALPDESPFNAALQTDATNIPTDEAPAKRNEVLSIAHDALAGFLKKNPKLQDLVQFSFYVEHDGGMQVYNPNTDPFIRINLHRLANNIWIDGQNNGSLTRAQVAEAAIETLRHEVEHVADLHAAKTIYEQLTPDQRAKEIAKYTKSLDAAGKKDFTEQGYVGWRRAYYSNMWNGWTPEQRQAIIDTYGDALLDRPDWIKGMEGSRMAITMKNFGFISEAVIRHVQAFLKAIKELITNPSKAFAKHIEEVEKAMAKLLGDTAEVSNDTTAEETPEITIKVKKDKVDEMRTLAFADPQDAAIFQMADKIDSLNKEMKPEERKKLTAEIAAFADALAAKLTADGTPTTRQQVLGIASKGKDAGPGLIRAYAGRVRTQAIEGNIFEPFTPQTFDSYTKHGNAKAESASNLKRIAKDQLKDPNGNDIISQLKELGRLAYDPNAPRTGEWEWYYALQENAKSSPLSRKEIESRAAQGNVDDPAALLAWVNANILAQEPGTGLAPDDAADQLSSGELGQTTPVTATELGPKILEAIAQRQNAMGKPATLDDKQAAEGDAVAAQELADMEAESLRTGKTVQEIMAERDAAAAAAMKEDAEEPAKQQESRYTAPQSSRKPETRESLNAVKTEGSEAPLNPRVANFDSMFDTLDADPLVAVQKNLPGITTPPTNAADKALVERASVLAGKKGGPPGVIPPFQGNKRDMILHAIPAILRYWTAEQRGQITELWDMFAGGGAWGLLVANQLFPNVKVIHVNEFDPIRAAKVRWQIEKGDTFEKSILDPRTQMALQTWLDAHYSQSEGNAWSSIRNSLRAMLEARQDAVTPEALGALVMILDDPSLSTPWESDDSKASVAEVTKWALSRHAVSAREIHKTAQQMRDRGVEFKFYNDDAYELPVTPGPGTFVLADPPYLFTLGYKGDDIVGNEIYTKTADLMERLVAQENHIAYTDEAWWIKPTLSDVVSDGAMSDAAKTTARIANTIDLTVVADLIGNRRYETLGLHNPLGSPLAPNRPSNRTQPDSQNADGRTLSGGQQGDGRDSEGAVAEGTLDQAGIQPTADGEVEDNPFSSPAALRAEILESQKGYISPKFKGSKAWLTPDGRWINVVEHYELAPPNFWETNKGFDRDLTGEAKAAGFARVVYDRNSGQLISEHDTLTPAQRSELKNTATELFADLVYDRGGLFSAPSLREQILAEQKITDKFTGTKAWLTPDAKWINVDSHYDIAPQGFIEREDWRYHALGEQARAAGFIRVQMDQDSNGKSLWIEYDKITPAQKRELKNTAIENGAEIDIDRGQLFSAPAIPLVEPGFYSQLQKVITEKMPNKADAKTIRGIITNPQTGIKADELKWTGVLNWLDEQTGTITKEQIGKYLADEGAVRFKEVRLGNPTGIEQGNVDEDFQSGEDEAKTLGLEYRWGASWGKISNSIDAELALREENIPQGLHEVLRKYHPKFKQGVLAPSKYSQYQTPGGPLSRDTEILTRTGWTRIDAVQIGELVLTRKDADGALEWQPVEAKPQVYAEWLYHFKSQSIDMQVTPCHTMVVKRRRRSNDNIVRMTAEKLWTAGECSVPLTGTYAQAPEQKLFGLDAKDVAEFFGWYLAEGSCVTANAKKSTISISQSRTANPGKCARLEALFSRMGAKWNYVASGPAYYVGIKSLPRPFTAEIHAIGNSATKAAPQWLLECSPEVLQLLYEALLLGDGTVTKQVGRVPSHVFFSKSKQLADQMQIIAVLLGKRGTVRQRKTGLYEVRIGLKKWSSVDDAKAGKVPYNDTAFCVTVENHAILVRRNGVAAFTGNSNYREVVLTMPVESAKPTIRRTKNTLEMLNPEGEVVARLGLSMSDEEAQAYYAQHFKSVDRTGNTYTSSHFSDVPNYVAHSRLNDRTDADSKPGTFIEELQSDRHQQARKEGYADGTPKYTVVKSDDSEEEIWLVKDRSGNTRNFGNTQQIAQDWADIYNRDISGSGIPDAPFRQSEQWGMHLFKRALKQAVDAGHAWIGWTKGIDQITRYSDALRQAVDRISWVQKSDSNNYRDYSIIIGEEQGSWDVWNEIERKAVATNLSRKQAQDFIDNLTVKFIRAEKNGQVTFLGHVDSTGQFTDGPAAGKSIDEVLGKEVAAKIESDVAGDLKGDNLTIGGEGMKGFYDQIMPKAVGKYVKQWGSKVEESNIDVSEGKPLTGREANQDGVATIWKVAITPQMKESVERGQALFSAPARGYESMTFDPPFKTSFGDIVSYDWMSKPVGGMTSQQVSDWNQARTNPVTGRPIVHHFRVRGPDGMATVSLETALGRLSPPDRSKLSGMIRTEQRRRQEEAAGQLTLFSSAASVGATPGKEADAQAIVANLDKVQAVRPLNAQEAADYAKAKAVVAQKEPSPGGLSEAEIFDPASIPVAPGETLVYSSGGSQFASDSPTTALAYAHNPGFGGNGRIYASAVPLNRVLHDPDWRELVSDAGLDFDSLREGWDRGTYMALEEPKVQQWLQENGYDAVSYLDDFPDSARVLFLVNEPDWQETNIDTTRGLADVLEEFGYGVSGSSIRQQAFDRLAELEQDARGGKLTYTSWNRVRETLGNLDSEALAEIFRAANITEESRLQRIALTAKDYSGFPDDVQDIRKQLTGDGQQGLIHFMVKDSYTAEETKSALEEIYKDAEVPLPAQKIPVAEISSSEDSEGAKTSFNGAATGNATTPPQTQPPVNPNLNPTGAEDRSLMASPATDNRDAEYMAAVEAGDMPTAQRMVDEAAESAGYNIGPVHHGTSKEFDVFNKRNRGAITEASDAKLGFWFAENHMRAHSAAQDAADVTGGNPRVVNAFLRMTNPYESYESVYESLSDPMATAKVIRKAKRDGHDGVTFYAGEGGVNHVVFEPSQIKSANPITRDESGKVIPLSQRFNPDSNSILYASPATDKQADMRQALESMPPIWREVLESSMNGQDADTIAARLNIPTEAVGNIQRVAEARLRILLDAAAGRLKPSVQPVQDNWYEQPTLKATAGRPDLALSGIPAVTAVDQRRAGPEEVTHAEMQTMANRMFALDLPATERMLKAWMESGGMTIDAESAPDGIKDIVKAANARQAGHMLMTAAAKLMVTRYALAGTNMLETANLIDLYRNTGTEQARALNMRRDPHRSPAERAAMFIQEALLTPPQAIQNEIAKNPGNKAEILKRWVTRAERIKRELIAEGYDIDATFQQFHVEQRLAEAVVPESVQPVLEQADPTTQRVVRSILEGESWAEAARNAGTPIATAREAYNTFRQGVKDAYQAFKREFLGASPADQISLLGLPEWTIDTNPDAVPVQTAATKALKQHRARRKVGGEFDLNNPLAAARVDDAIAMRKATLFDKTSEFWRASILTGIHTPIVNVVSGMTYGAYEATVKKLGAGALADIARMFGMKSDAASLSDIPAMLAATLPAVRQAFRDAMRTWEWKKDLFDAYASGQTPDAKNSKRFKEQYQPALKGVLGEIMRGASFRHMGAADTFVKSLFARIEVAAQARQIARAQGHKGIALANAISEQMQPGSLAWLRALEHAKKITFQQKLGSTEDTISKLDGLAKIIKNTKQGQFGGMPKALSLFIFPFVDTPTNIFKQAVTISPLGGLLAIVDATQALRRLKQGNKEQAAKLYNAARALSDLTNQIVAWGAVLAIAEMVKPGDDDDKTPSITGTIPWRAMSKGEREIAYRTAPPQSIRIGDKWYSYRRLDPFATALAFVVDSIRDLQSGKPADEILPKIGVNMLHNLQDKTFLQGISDFMNAVQDPNRFGTKWATNIAVGFMPNLVRQSIRSGDDVFRENDLPNDMTFWDVLGRRIGFGMYPVGSDDSMLPRNALAPLPATDVWGRPASKNTGTGGPNTDFLLRLFSPVDTRDTTNVDPLDVRLLRWNMANPDDAFAMTAPTREIKRTINGKPVSVSLSDAEHADLTAKSGQAARQAIGNRYNDRDLTKEDVKQIRQVTDKAHDMFRELAFRKHYKP